MRSVTFLLTGLATAIWMSGAAVAEKEIGALKETGKAFASIARQALPGVVFIDVESTVEVEVPSWRRTPFEEFFGRSYRGNEFNDQPTRKYQQQGQGSGFIISKDGYIFTNNHVVGDADRITVTLADGRTFEATVVGSDPKTEVALIKIDGDGDLPCLALGDSDALAVGEWVLAAGNPFGLSQTITAGIVSAKERSEIGITDYANFIQTDAAINPGNSGGPLLNIQGEVVGINTAIYSQSGGYMGIGFAIPINQAAAIRDQLMAYGSIRRSVLGIMIQDVDEELAESFGMEDPGGIVISQVLEGSAAETAGLRAGDIVTELNGDKVGKTGSFRSRVAALAPDTEVRLKIFRDGTYTTVRAVTAAMDDVASVANDSGAALLEKLGLSVQDADADSPRRAGAAQGGVRVSAVVQGGVAWQAGLRQGYSILSVNRQRVDEVDTFIRMLGEAAEHGRVLLLVTDGHGSRFVVLPLG